MSTTAAFSKQAMVFRLVFYCLFATVAQAQIIPSEVTLNSAVTSITELIKSQTNEISNDYPFIAGFVRLAFHDCVGAGGCDGCVNLADSHNAGLENYIANLTEIYNDNNFNGVISRADFWALASEVALEMATTDTVDKYTGVDDFKVGREDCTTSPDEDDENEAFPSATGGSTEMFDYFSTYFGFNQTEVAALMGAHALGRCTHANSGFVGPWTNGRFSTVTPTRTSLPPTSTLDNAYYHMLITQITWVQTEVEGGKMQWQVPLNPVANTPDSSIAAQFPILLNTDMALAWNFTALDDYGTVSCNALVKDTPASNTCPTSDAYDATASFAADNAEWLVQFKSVFKKMSEMNDNTLQLAWSKKDPIDKLISDVGELEEEIDQWLNDN